MPVCIFLNSWLNAPDGRRNAIYNRLYDPLSVMPIRTFFATQIVGLIMNKAVEFVNIVFIEKDLMDDAELLCEFRREISASEIEKCSKPDAGETGSYRDRHYHPFLGMCSVAFQDVPAPAS